MTRVLVTGFGPWGSLPSNPTLAILDHLAGDDGLTTLALPVASAAVEATVARVLAERPPSLWIALGLAMGSSVIAVERIAANLLDFTEADNGGLRPVNRPVIEGGPAAHLATVPVQPIVDRLREAAIPARASQSAGTFLCNQLMYTALHRIAEQGLPTRFGFIHVPPDPGLVARLDGRAGEGPSMGLDLAASAVRLAIETALTTGA